jgi:histone acetyltransferase (RNA polymerase elongator complex component)
MKKHAIIPIFIPHLGCPEKCVFCDQRRITARLRAPSEADVRATKTDTGYRHITRGHVRQSNGHVILTEWKVQYRKNSSL